MGWAAGLFGAGAIVGAATGYLYTTPSWPFAVAATLGIVLFVFGLLMAEDPP